MRREAADGVDLRVDFHLLTMNSNVFGVIDQRTTKPSRRLEASEEDVMTGVRQRVTKMVKDTTATAGSTACNDDRSTFDLIDDS